jgi:charged multivesicular body protein 3
MNARLAEQLGTARVAGSLQKSAEVMALVNGLVKVPQLMTTMRNMSREMAKAGMIDEMVGEAIDGAVTEEGEDEEAEAEVDKVLMEIAGADMESLAAAAAPKAKQKVVESAPAAAEEEGEEGIDDLKARLEAVRN